MRYRPLGRTGMKVSVLCLGTMTFGWQADQETSFAIMDAAVDAGINFFDTADIYPRWAEGSYAGQSEEILGHWLARQRGRRDRLIIATKLRNPMSEGDPNDQGLSRRHIMRSIEGSLRRLQTDYIDLYQSHWYDEETAPQETLRAYEDLIRDGKVRAIGCSNFPAWMLMESLWTSDRLNTARYESLQPHYNLVHRAEFERELQQVCLKYGLGVIPYSPLAAGFLTGKYRRGAGAPADSRGEQSGNIKKYMSRERNYDVLEHMEQLASARRASVGTIALAWLLAAPAVTSAIIGARRVDQLQDNLDAGTLELSREEWQALAELSSWREQ